MRIARFEIDGWMAAQSAVAVDRITYCADIIQPGTTSYRRNNR